MSTMYVTSSTSELSLLAIVWGGRRGEMGPVGMYVHVGP